MSIIKELRQLTEAAGQFVWLVYVDTEQNGAIDLQDLDTVEVHSTEAGAVRAVLDMMDMEIDGSDNPKLVAAAEKVRTRRQLDALVDKFNDELDMFDGMYSIVRVQVK